jgi:Family of unknown function (DUF6580)
MKFVANRKDTSMLAKTPKPERAPSALWTDLLLAAFLIGFDVVARLLPHAPGFMPVAASALFAGRMLRVPGVAPIVPIAAMALSGMAMGPDDWRVTLIVYAAISVPALAGMASRRWRGMVVPFAVMLPCSLFFFAASNFAVWAFSGLYSLDWQGLTQCFIAALPFLQNTIAGDMFWTAALFGGAWMVQGLPALSRSR